MRRAPRARGAAATWTIATLGPQRVAVLVVRMVGHVSRVGTLKVGQVDGAGGRGGAGVVGQATVSATSRRRPRFAAMFDGQESRLTDGAPFAPAVLVDAEPQRIEVAPQRARIALRFALNFFFYPGDPGRPLTSLGRLGTPVASSGARRAPQPADLGQRRSVRIRAGRELPSDG